MVAFGTLLLIANVPVVAGRIRLDSEMSGLFGSLYNMRNIVLPFVFAIAIPFYTRTLSMQEESRMLLKALVLVSGLAGIFFIVLLICPRLIITTLYGGEFVGAVKYIIPYGLSIYLEMLAVILTFQQAAKRNINLPILVIPITILFIGLALPNINISSLVKVQIFVWLIFIACIMSRRIFYAKAIKR